MLSYIEMRSQALKRREDCVGETNLPLTTNFPLTTCSSLPNYLLATNSLTHHLPTYHVSQILKRREECVGETNLATGESSYILGTPHHPAP